MEELYPLVRQGSITQKRSEDTLADYVNMA
jgi:hypothetical protein